METTRDPGAGTVLCARNGKPLVGDLVVINSGDWQWLGILEEVIIEPSGAVYAGLRHAWKLMWERKEGPDKGEERFEVWNRIPITPGLQGLTTAEARWGNGIRKRYEEDTAKHLKRLGVDEQVKTALRE